MEALKAQVLVRTAAPPHLADSLLHRVPRSKAVPTIGHECLRHVEHATQAIATAQQQDTVETIADYNIAGLEIEMYTAC